MKRNHWFFRAAGILAAVILAACPTEGGGGGGGGSNSPAAALPVAMVNIPGGSFQMGSPVGTPDSEDTERPVHQVTLTAFKMGKYEVTQGQWYEVMGDTPSGHTANPEGSGSNGWMALPVEMVSWYDALVFCNKLSMRENLSPAYKISGKTDPAQWGPVPTSDSSPWEAVEVVAGAAGYRLPTEAQWEYAARGGKASPGGFKYAGSNTADEVAWYDGNSGGIPHQVGQKAPNGLGLYDMSGNVYEWCWDWYDPNFYSGSPQTNPVGASSGMTRVVRSSCWYDQDVRSAARSSCSPWFRADPLGFRIVRP